MMTNFRVRYIGDDRADIRNGEVYEATDLVDCTTMYGVIDRTGEMYAYPKSLFEIVTDDTAYHLMKNLQSGFHSTGGIKMISSKAEQIKNRLLEFCCLISFNYRGVYCDIDPFNPQLFHVMCGKDEQDVGSIEEVMESPLFAGACLNDIADEIDILEW